MNRIFICYEIDGIEGNIAIDSKADFKEMKRSAGWNKIKVLEESLCRSKKEIMKFEKFCIEKYVK